MQGLSFGAVFAGICKHVPAQDVALIHGDRTVRWGEFDRATDALAAAFLRAGAVQGDKVAHLMRNSPAYLLTTIAAFKARMVHVNVNYRYTGEELFYILDNSDAAVVVYDAEFAEVMASLKDRLPLVKLWLQVGRAPERPDFALDFDAACAGPAELPPQDHRYDDMMFIYTGGTTGYPKGVMWDQGAVWTMLGGGAAEMGGAPAETIEALKAQIATGLGRHRMLVMPPLMHGSGFLMAIYTLARGGSVVTLTDRSFQALEALDACARHRPDQAVIVGDAFARPLLRALDEGAGEISSLVFMISSGTMWSPEVKAGLLRHNPSLLIIDSLGSSESLGMGAAVQTADNAGAATRFLHDENTIVVDEDMQPVTPGSGQIGRVARGGLIPRGYYKDPVKTAATFVTIGGQRYSMAGDHATVEADGTMVLMGRGNQCINSGGEKIFPEEVEETLKLHPAVEDALVFGVADDKWGQAVTAVVETRETVAEAELMALVRQHLAAYKAPKHILFVAKVPRAPNGKADYAAAKALAAARAAA